VTWTPSRRLEVNLRIVETLRDFLDPDRETDSLRAGLSASWRPRRNWRVHLFSDFRDLEDSESVDQTDLMLGARADLDFGKLDITPVLSWTRRERGESETRDLSAMIRIRRSF
jgi:hypothetical protein